MDGVAKRDLSEASLNNLIELLYQTLEDNKAWQPFFERCCDAVGAKMLHMIGHDLAKSTVAYSHGAYMPADGELAMMHKYQYIDPIHAYAWDFPVLQWMHDHEMIGESVMASHPFHQEFLRPHDIKYRHMIKLLQNENAIVMLGLLTSPSQGPLPEECFVFLNKLLPHFARVCRLSAQNFVYSTQALVGQALVNKLRQPVILASVTGEVVHINDAGHALLATTKLLTIEDGVLQLPEPFHASFYDDCMEMESRLKQDSQQTPDAQSSAFKLLQLTNSQQSESLYTFYSLLLPQRMMGAYGLRPLVMMFFYHPESAPQIDASILSAAFDLTPAECKVAILAAEGISQKDMATRLGLQPDTVRKQLQIIYQKTNTHQQTELMRLMLNLPSNFVQEPRKQEPNKQLTPKEK